MRYLIHFLFLLGLLFVSCKETPSDRIIRLVNEWENREIVYPARAYFTILEKDTIRNKSASGSKYSIVTYVDALGCMSCNLHLSDWKNFIVQLDSITNSSVPINFFFCPKNRNEILDILKRNDFNYPVCIDVSDSLNIMNHFPVDMNFRTFLLDNNNKIIAIGNPVLNPQIKELYLNIIQGQKKTEIDKDFQTEVATSDSILNMESFSWNDEQEREIILKNTGNYLLVINDIITSCGCTTVEYSKEPVQIGKSLILKVKYKAEHPESFNKTITVYCNAKNAPLQLKISGNAK